ncbi:hypothetical protein F5J12DRAFT_5209 [Pisolithus orientalis]|uniref:uncharacterized protein n=1 Tax=Pisolithus orientalis TaxID=936130 RepID=UPI0022241002|nr:uncharacterized protein F5J12DRAFT_5209 [Pisolithus orientalis]KAI6034947.1 hypothetical protein F5J12DRAFT_5209 [Pisolithus orientalis]
MANTINLKYLPNLTHHVESRLHDYVVDCVVNAVEFSRGNLFPHRCCPPSQLPEFALLKQFVTRMIKKSGISVYGIAVSLVYIDRLKREELLTNYKEAIYERLFIGALILALKHIYPGDSTTSCDWAKASLLFNRVQVEELELEFIGALDRRLDVAGYELLLHQLVISQIVSSLTTPRICPLHDNSRPMRANFWSPHHYNTTSSRTLPVLQGCADINKPLPKTPCRNYFTSLFPFSGGTSFNYAHFMPVRAH